MTDAITPTPAAAARDLALRRYAVVLPYLQYENTVYWTRFHIFFLANSGLFGLLATALPLDPCVTRERAYTLGVGALAGCLLAVFWWCILTAAEGWIRRWHQLLGALEPAAFEGYQLFRGVEEHERKFQIKTLAKATVGLFIVMWLLTAAHITGVLDWQQVEATCSRPARVSLGTSSPTCFHPHSRCLLRSTGVGLPI